MRILFVTNNYTPYSGGVVSSIDATVRELRSQGHEVIIVTLDFLGRKDIHEEHIIRVACPIRFMYKNNHMAIPWRPTHELYTVVKNYEPHIIHVHHPFLLGVSGLEVARMYDIPCIFTYHALYEQFAHYVPVPQLCSQPIISWKVKHFCSAVDGIVVPSRAVKQYLRENNIIIPIEVIPSGLRAPFFSWIHPSPQQTHKKFFELLVVSRFSPEKNIPFVFDIFKILADNVHLTLIGYGAEYDNAQKLAFDQLQLPAERVRFIHKPSQETLLNCYKTADLFVFPSQSDTQGLVIAEAMSQGLPVIALDGAGQRDIIVNGENGFIVEDAQMAAEIIKKIVENNVLHSYLQQKARATALRYSPLLCTQQLLTFYETLTANLI